MHIVTTADNNYAQHLGVMLYSLFRNKKQTTHIKIFIIDGGISEKNKDRLTKLTNKFNFPMTYLIVEPNIYRGFHTKGHINETVYYRLSIPDLFDRNLDKVLHIDCDTVIRRDLSELWNIDISAYYLAAVKDWAVHEIGYSRPNCYFNAGVMLLNLKKIRKDRIMLKVIDYIKDNPNLDILEQDALNAIIKDNYMQLPVTFNVTTFAIRNNADKLSPSCAYRSNAVKDPHIVHFAGADKPWLFCNDYPYKKIYYRYLWKTPWRFYLPSDLNYLNIKYSFLSRHAKTHTFLKRLKKYWRVKIASW